MDLPAIMPQDLREIASARDDRSLYDMLLNSTEKLTRFIAYAADDETWSSAHKAFYHMAFNWYTNQYQQNRISNNYVKSLVTTLHAHYGVLEEVLPRPIEIQVGTSRFSGNPLVLGFMSSYFKSRMVKEDKSIKIIIIREKNIELVQIALQYLESGNSGSLWRFEKPQILELMELAEKWGVEGLVKECEEVVKRYISSNNVEEELISAFQKRSTILLEKVFEIYNEKYPAAKIFSESVGTLSFELADLGEKSLSALEPVKSILTHIHFQGDTTQDVTFVGIMEQCLKLEGLSIRQTNEWSPYLEQIPCKVHDLDLSECAWLGDQELRLLINYVPQISVLSLAQDTQLTYRGFSELKNLRGLKSLNLSRCSQLDNESLNLILQGSPTLQELNLYSCRKLSDQAFYELARKEPHLQKIKLSRTLITDGGLAEIASRCQDLIQLELNHCLNITEGGLFDCLKAGKRLRRLSLKENRLDVKALQSLKDTHPSVKILY